MSATKKSLRFSGVAHPPPHVCDGSTDCADLTSAEIRSQQLGGGVGTQILYEHDHTRRVGTVHASWMSLDGSMQVRGVIDDDETAKRVRSGELRGLSLGTRVLHDVKGKALVKHQEELSLCKIPRRPQCWVNAIDGVPVSTISCASMAKGKS